MDHQYSGWSMIPNIPAQGSSPTTSNQENLYLQQQQQQFQLQQHQNLFLQQTRLQYQQSPQQMQIPPPKQQQQTLASQFSLQHLVGNLAVAIEKGTLDQHSDVLVADLNSHFEKCQKLLNTIASTTGSKNMVCVEAWSRCGVHCWFSMQTVEGQKSKLQENEQLLTQRRELIAKFKTSVEELIKTDHSSQLPL